MKTIASVLMFCCLAFAQAKPSSVQTKGACSPVVTGNGNTITIRTCGLTKGEVQEWRASFKQILEKQIDPKVLVALLEEIKNGQIRIENGVLRIEGKVSDIQKSQKGRTLNVQQQDQIASAMSLFRGQHILFNLRPDDEEASQFLESLASVLSQAGLTLSNAHNAGMAIPPGMILKYGKDNPHAALAFSRALTAVGIPNQAIPVDSMADYAFVMFIGAKPIGQNRE
jgi:hypothetical protein